MHTRLTEGLVGRSGTTRPVPETASPEPRLILRVLEGGHELPLDGERSIGRAAGNDLVLSDEAVSGRHCLVLPQPRGCIVYDCRSTNGTWLNGTRVAAAEVAPGALLVVGRTHMRAMRPHTAPPAEVPGIVASSRSLADVLARLRRVAPTPLSVLVLGESGTGKELIARAIHALSPRAAGPFVAVNCSAIPGEVAESELFGHERGAFTGALAARPGVFEEAHGGTLFLDEVGDLPAAIQPKLLRALENRVVRRVGGRGELPVDVRVVAATNRDLSRGFRMDLFHRLARVVLRLPPLRDRRDDIPALVEHFLAEIARDHGPCSLAPGAMEALCAHDWPGNVRELRNVVERAALLGGPVLTARELLEGAQPKFIAADSLESVIAGRSWEDVERTAIAVALKRADGNQRTAAQMLGLARTTLADRARKHGLL